MMITPGLFYGTILWWRGQSFGNFYQDLKALKPRKLGARFKNFGLVVLLSLYY